MSEEAKLEYLRQKMKEVNSTRRIYDVVFICGLVAFCLGLFIEALSLIVMGIALGIIGTVVGMHFNLKKDRLMEQLRKMGYKDKEK